MHSLENTRLSFGSSLGANKALARLDTLGDVAVNQSKLWLHVCPRRDRAQVVNPNSRERMVSFLLINAFTDSVFLASFDVLTRLEVK